MTHPVSAPTPLKSRANTVPAALHLPMQITLNGTEREIPDDTTLEMLIQDAGIGQAACAAEVNKTLVPKRQHADHTLSEGDQVELVTLVGGG